VPSEDPTCHPDEDELGGRELVSLGELLAEEPGLGSIRCQQLLEAIAEMGSVEDACAVCSVTEEQLIDHITADPSFEDRIKIHLGRFRATVRDRIRDLAMNGYQVPIVGGKNKDKILEWQTLPDPKSIELLAKMHFSKEMAQYTRSAVVTQERRPRDVGDKLNTKNLTREERRTLDELLEKATRDTDIKEIEDSESKKGGKKDDI
jgi:hypothetical protein